MNTEHLKAQIVQAFPGKFGDTEIRLLTEKVKGWQIDNDAITAAVSAARFEPSPMMDRLADVHDRLLMANRQAERASAGYVPTTHEPDRLRTMRGHMHDFDGQPLRVVCSWYRDAAERSIRLRGWLRPSWLTNATDELVSAGGATLDQAESWAGRVYAEYPYTPPDKADRTPLQIKFAELGVA
jgi:hypothetical protein